MSSTCASRQCRAARGCRCRVGGRQPDGPSAPGSWAGKHGGERLKMSALDGLLEDDVGLVEASTWAPGRVVIFTAMAGCAGPGWAPVPRLRDRPAWAPFMTSWSLLTSATACVDGGRGVHEPGAEQQPGRSAASPQGERASRPEARSERPNRHPRRSIVPGRGAASGVETAGDVPWPGRRIAAAFRRVGERRRCPRPWAA